MDPAVPAADDLVPPATPSVMPRGPVDWVPDLSLELGLSLGSSPWRGLGRVRTGVVRADASDLGHPFFFAVGAFAELSGLGPAVIGVQAETMSLLWGLSAGVGAGIDLDGELAVHVTAGWSLFTLELQHRRVGERHESHVFAKLRLPIGAIGWLVGR